MNKRIEKSGPFVMGVLVILLFGSGAELMTTSNESEMPGVVLKTMVMPIIILTILSSVYWTFFTGIFKRNHKKKNTIIRSKIKTTSVFLGCIPVMFVFLCVITQAAASIYNRTFGEQEQSKISGPIIGKEHSVRSSEFCFIINDKHLGRNVEIRVDSNDYQIYQKGDTYTTEHMIGSLGFIYYTH